MKFITTCSEQSKGAVLPILFVLFSAGLTAHILNLSYFVLLVIALAKLFQKQVAGTSFHEVYQSSKALHWAMASMLVALLVSQLGHGYTDLSPYNPIARLATFVLVLWLLLNLDLTQLRLLQWAWTVGAVLCAAQVYFSLQGGMNRPDIENWRVALTSLLGVFSVLSLAWNERPGKLTVIAHLFGGACGMYVIYVSQTRGVWIALPLYILATYLTFVANALSKKNILLLLAGMALFAVVFFNTNLAQNRIHQAEQDIHVFSVNRNADTSVGVRFQLWQAAWIMIQEHPLIGVGSGEHYKAALQDMVDRKVLPTYYNGAHSHNEILYSTATMGILGCLAILLTYLVPGYYFGRNLLHPDRQTRAAAAMGISVCAGFMIFGLVDVLFKYKETEVFYCISCAVLYAFIISRKKQLLAAQAETNV